MTLPLSEFPVGSLWTRSEIHQRLGGNIQSGHHVRNRPAIHPNFQWAPR